MTIINTYLGPHSGEANNPLTFDEAYDQATASPTTSYTTPNGTAFLVAATVGQKGVHADQKVLKFMDGTTERGRAYAACWGHKTNVKGQRIDLYSEAMAKASTD